MPDVHLIINALVWGLAATMALSFCTWVVSLFKADASIVDSMWSVLIFSCCLTYVVVLSAADTPRAIIVLALAAMWALRLAVYITWRNWGEPEDHRYQAIRMRNQPNFEWKSLYLVFIFQAVLAWVVSMPLLAGVASVAGDIDLGFFDIVGAAIVLFGVMFEAIGDWQLARFKRDSTNVGHVMDQGLWRYTRHPNYFGEFCVWWGFYFISCAAGVWWTIVSPLLMTVLLLKISGVALLEKDIGERKPAYREYILRTSAFFPWFPKDRL